MHAPGNRSSLRDYRKLPLQDYGGASLAAFRKIGVPEETCGHGAPGFPRCADRFEFLRSWTFAKALHFLDGGCEREIAGGPDVGTAEGGEEINVCGPAADALESDEHFARSVIVEIVEVAKVEVAAGERFGEKSRVKSFLAAETDAKQFGVGEF